MANERKHWTYGVERKNSRGEWMPIMGAQGNRSFALGYLYGATDPIPHAAHRVVRWRYEGKEVIVEIVEEKGACKGVQLN